MVANAPIAPHRLRILIVGASLAGLACAYTLTKAGHDVVVFEQRDGPSKSHATLRCPPHMTRLLMRWGVTDEWLAAHGAPLKRAVFIDASKDGARAAIDTADVFTGDFAPYLCPRHSSLVSWLVDLVKSHGIEVRYGAQIVHVDPQRPSVHLSSGDVEVGDLVIGADGYKSQIRTLVSGEELEFLQPHRVQYSMRVPSWKLQRDPVLATLMVDYDWNVFCYDDRILQAYHDPSSNNYYFELSWSNKEPIDLDGRWETSYPASELGFFNDGPNDGLRRLWTVLEDVVPIPTLRYEPLDSWVHENNKVILVGDAAAPYPLSGMYTSTAALEDAEVLGALLGRVRRPEQIPALLAVYDELRPPRVEDLARRELDQIATILAMWKQDPSANSDTAHLSEEELLMKRLQAVFEMTGYDTFQAAEYDCYEVATDYLQQWPNLLEEAKSPRISIQQNVVVHE